MLNSGLQAFQKMLEEDKNGVKPLYRSREWNKEEKPQKPRKNSVGGTQRHQKFNTNHFVCRSNPRRGFS